MQYNFYLDAYNSPCLTIIVKAILVFIVDRRTDIRYY